MGSDEYPLDWNSRRKKVYRRDGYECQNCGAIGGKKGNAELHAHHVVPKSKGGSHDTSNLVTVCKECHNAVHGSKQAPTSASQSSFVHVIESLYDMSDDQDDFGDAYEEATALASLYQDDFSGPRLVRDSHLVREKYEYVRKQTTKLEKVQWELDYEKIANRPPVERNKKYIKSKYEKYKDIRHESLGYMSKISAISQKYAELIERVECNDCGEPAEAGTQFCGSCGNELQDPLCCNECGETIENVSQAFCRSCGTELIGFPEETIEETNRIMGSLEDLKQDLVDNNQRHLKILNELNPEK